MQYLSEMDINRFKEDGFLLVKNFYSRDEISKVSDWINMYAKKKPEDWELGKEMAYYETSVFNKNERILSRIENFVEYHQGFRDVVNSEQLKGLLQDLVGEPCVLFKEKIIFKFPGAGGFGPHQDAQARWDDHASYFINASITIDENTPENGCLEFASGHAKRGLIGKYDAHLEDKDLEGMNFVTCPTRPGDIIFFDFFTPHKSTHNLSDKSRRNLYLTYNRLSEGDVRLEYYARKRKEFPPDNERYGMFPNDPILQTMYDKMLH